jgi:hypothetical protein
MLVCVVVAMSSPASAERFGFLRFAGGGNVPIADGTWNQSTVVGAKIAGGIGAMFGPIGVAITGDAGQILVADDEDLFAMDASNRMLREVRLLGHAVYDLPGVIRPNVTLGFRAGAGADIMFVSYDRIVFGNNAGKSFTKVGLAIELGAAAWFHVGTSLEIGPELALPIAVQSSDTAPGGATGFNYTAVGLDLLFALRVSSRD